jgi:anthranilate synthase component 2
MELLILDNYDSFTFNLHHYLVGEGASVAVKRNDEIDLDEALGYRHIVLSPGPGLPSAAGIMPALLNHLPNESSVLGVCLGMQAIVERFGGRLSNLNQVIHGQSSMANSTSGNDVLFAGIENPFQIGHYHSWVAEELGEELVATSRNEDGLIMSVRHTFRPIFGVQFHPESVLTPQGRRMIQNWLAYISKLN